MFWSYLVADWRGQSGPAVARWFHRALALTLAAAWVSMAVQVKVLIGARGLLPLGPFLEAAKENGLRFWEFPTLFWRSAPDWLLVGLAWFGAAMALVALAGFLPRVWLALSIPLYLSYATACRTFTGFQWDNLLLECLVVAVFLPRDRPARLAHIVGRIVLFKLYFESGIAKWQSHLGDWQNGSAMTYYYETAPLPTWMAWYAHHLPVWWHHFESWATLALELILPFGIFLIRPIRLFTLVTLTLFQLVNLLTANYGYFVYLALVLHLFLLDERDLLRKRSPTAKTPTPLRFALDLAAGTALLSIVMVVSITEAIVHFGDSQRWNQSTETLRSAWEPFRLVNTYHLFGHITRERIEPELQTLDNGVWTPRHLRHKPGDLARAPDFVAPHQPRVDFQLWFHGLGYRGGTPEYVITLVDRLCRDPQSVQPLFAESLPPKPDAARILYWRYHFTTVEEKRQTGNWWKREQLASTRAIPCNDSPKP